MTPFPIDWDSRRISLFKVRHTNTHTEREKRFFFIVSLFSIQCEKNSCGHFWSYHWNVNSVKVNEKTIRRQNTLSGNVIFCLLSSSLLFYSEICFRLFGCSILSLFSIVIKCVSSALSVCRLLALQPKKWEKEKRSWKWYTLCICWFSLPSNWLIIRWRKGTSWLSLHEFNFSISMQAQKIEIKTTWWKKLKQYGNWIRKKEEKTVTYDNLVNVYCMFKKTDALPQYMHKTRHTDRCAKENKEERGKQQHLIQSRTIQSGFCARHIIFDFWVREWVKKAEKTAHECSKERTIHFRLNTWNHSFPFLIVWDAESKRKIFFRVRLLILLMPWKLH